MRNFDLPNWITLAVQEDDLDCLFTTEYTEQPAGCLHCGFMFLDKHGKLPSLFRDIPHSGKRTGIMVQRQRYRCKSCHKTFLIHRKIRIATKTIQIVNKRAPGRGPGALHAGWGYRFQTIIRLLPSPDRQRHPRRYDHPRAPAPSRSFRAAVVAAVGWGWSCIPTIRTVFLCSGSNSTDPG